MNDILVPLDGSPFSEHAVPVALRALSTLAPGDAALVQTILFSAMRTLCSDLGIREGETVQCRAGTGGMLVLETQDGHTVSLSRDWARYIRVGPMPS